MALILGGTTEGRRTVDITEEAGKPYYYSTKGNEQEINLQHGTRLTDALIQTTMKTFCRENGIRLLVGTAHPFVEQLHATATTVSQALGIPCVRYERMYGGLFRLFNEEMYDEHPLKLKEKYKELSELPNEEGTHRVLALTGVQPILKLKPFQKKKEDECYFRVPDRESSRETVQKVGFPEDHLIYYTPGKENLPESLRQLSPEVVLPKESGVSRGFSKKVNIIAKQGIRLYIPLRPSLPPYDQIMNGVDGMRYTIEHFLPDFLSLRSGPTTGTCVTAAASVTLWKPLSPVPGNRIKDVSVLLPNGEEIAVPVRSATGLFTGRRTEVSCTVTKDGNDDPDVTDELPIVATVSIDISEERPHTGGGRQQVVQVHDG